MRETLPALMRSAIDIRARAHAPYSRYRVGAAVEDESGRVHVGCNVENAAYPEGLCAEAAAIAAMVAAGGRRIAAIAVAGGRESPEPCTPCGGCRQKIREFADDETRILLLDEDGGTVVRGIEELLPGGFTLAREPSG